MQYNTIQYNILGEEEGGPPPGWPGHPRATSFPPIPNNHSYSYSCYSYSYISYVSMLL